MIYRQQRIESKIVKVISKTDPRFSFFYQYVHQSFILSLNLFLSNDKSSVSSSLMRYPALCIRLQTFHHLMLFFYLHQQSVLYYLHLIFVEFNHLWWEFCFINKIGLLFNHLLDHLPYLPPYSFFPCFPFFSCLVIKCDTILMIIYPWI